MKKKIKDLTLEDLQNICLKYSYDRCDDCPLNNNVCTYYFNVTQLYNLYNKELDEEIEVEEDEK